MKKNRNLEPLFAIITIILISGLAYLPLIHKLGYYHDDWFTVVSKIGGTSLTEMHSIDRPLMGSLYEITYAMFGDIPLAWHLFVYGVRLTGGLVFLWLLRMIWPEKHFMTTAMTVFFTVYPGFLLQPSANNYSNHLISYTLSIISIAFSIRSLITKQRLEKFVLIPLSALLILIYPRIYETIIGMEGVRLILMWYVVSKQLTQNILQRVKYVFLQWTPYLTGMLVFLYWRFFRFKSVRYSTDASVLLDRYLQSPFHMSASILADTMKDLVEASFLAWAVPLYQVWSKISPIQFLFAIILAATAAAILWVYYHKITTGAKSSSIENSNANSQQDLEIVWVGFLSLLITILPVTLSIRHIDYSYNLNRYTLQTIAGTAIFMVGLINYALQSPFRKWALMSLLGLAMITHYSNAIDYQKSWYYQNQLWWQLSWRAPQLKPDTTLIAQLPANHRHAEGFEIWAPANLIYYPNAGKPVITAEILTPETLKHINAEETTAHDFRTVQYENHFENTLLLVLNSSNTCLHVIDKNQIELSNNLDIMINQAAEHSNVERILTEQQTHIPPAAPFGNEPPHDWCYYYQKANLARQKNDWQEIAALYTAAVQNNYAPQDLSEWLPFLEAYVNLENKAQADQIAQKIKNDEDLQKTICQYLQPEDSSYLPTYSSKETYAAMIDILCSLKPQDQ